jgi:hypothetical protein
MFHTLGIIGWVVENKFKKFSCVEMRDHYYRLYSALWKISSYIKKHRKSKYFVLVLQYLKFWTHTTQVFFHYSEGGSSNDKCTDTYHGPDAFSEPETAAVRDFILSRYLTRTCKTALSTRNSCCSILSYIQVTRTLKIIFRSRNSCCLDFILSTYLTRTCILSTRNRCC